MKKPNKYSYTAVFTPETDGGYSVHFPQLNGCYTQGDNYEDAQRMAADAMSLFLYTLETDSGEIPAEDVNINTKDGELSVPITAWMALFRDGIEKRSVKNALTCPQE